MNGFTREDLEKNKVAAGLGFIMFFLPLLICRDSKLGRYCANQGLLLMLVNLIAGAVLGIFTGVPLIGWVFALAIKLIRLVITLVALGCFVMLVRREKLLELPVIGGFRIIQ